MNLLGTLAKISGMTTISRVLGFVRDTVIAQIFGSTAATDAFVVAFKLPNLLRRVFAEGAFSQAFVPILSEYKNNKSQDETISFVQHVAGMLFFAVFLVTLIGIIAAPWVIWICAPGFVAAADNDKFLLAVSLLKITFPYILLISLSSFVGSILNTFNRFTIPAFTPVFLNISMIFFAIVISPYLATPITALAWGVLIGGILQLSFQLPFLYRIGFLHLPKLNFHDSGVTRVLKQMLPAIFGVSVAQISLLINTIFASFLPDGSISWLYYADRLMELPTGVLGVALGTMLLPTLSKHSAGNNNQEFSALLDWGIRLTCLLALPAAIGLAVLSFPLISTLFMYRKFGLEDALMTQQALIAYTVGLIGLILIKVLAPGFYARQDIKTPVKVAVITLIFTQILNISLIWHFKHAGLALAIALGACLNATILYVLLRRRKIYQPQNGQKIFMLRIIIACVVMGLILYFLQYQNIYQLDWTHSATQRILQLFALIVVGVIAYFATLFGLGFRINQIRRIEK
ncbi:MAG: murein biosynthesis integral membrane protein MurJ [Neisseriaceae bacterium]|nr:murein biosynthesis integral membrane protein MurJ [Neisseriaceae bacterium]